MHLERTDQLAHGHRAVFADHMVVAGRLIQLAGAGARGVKAGGGEARQPVGTGHQRAPPLEQGADRLGDGGAGRDHDLQLGSRQLELEARIAAQPGQHLRRPGCQLEGVRIEHHHLVLDPHRVGGGRVEARAQLGCARGWVWRLGAHGNGTGAMRLLPLPGVFQPPSDSYMLADQLRRERLGPGVRVLDLCTGSGHLAIVAALAGASTVAVDVSRRAVLSVRLNAVLNGVRVKALRGDLFAPVADRRFDVIVSNPPYLPHPDEELPERGLARAIDAGPRGRAFLDRICARVGEHLTAGGVLLLVHSSVCGEAETLEALAARGLQAEVAYRHRGSLGPVLRARADWLRSQGLLLEGDQEEVIVFRAIGSRAAG